ncbi:Transcription initiation factor TFIID subunit 10 [Arthrobotrys musiformis]|uniref:Transcription initiation factor TFIID subunit 10 n=1 Tax=Arthrobotrys musiformis TaxID=47236 RepID=A0AAV9WF40_9PEZI
MATPIATSFDTNPDTDVAGATSEDVDMTSSAPQNATDASMATTVANTNPNAPNGNVSMNAAGGGGENGPLLNGVPGDIEMRVPRRERNLREFLGMMDEYAPIIPDAVTDYYLALSGFHTTDVRIKRLLALATQKFIADIAADAYQYARIRTSSSNANAFTAGGAIPGAAGGALGGAGGGGGYATSGRRGGRMVLTMDDLGGAVAEYGVNTKRPEFYR